MNWRMAGSLDVLLAQINALSPNRDKSSDGGIGNAEHASRSSDHNPWIKDGAMGVVTARDFTNDPAHGIDSEKLAEALLASRDPRIKYVISNKKIASGIGEGHTAWQWRPYTGASPHNHHCHVSVKSIKLRYDDTAAWAIDLEVQAEHKDAPVAPSIPVLRKGMKDLAPDGPVHRLQTLLKARGAMIAIDGGFGHATETAVIAFQKHAGLHADGVAGKYTLTALGEI